MFWHPIRLDMVSVSCEVIPGSAKRQLYVVPISILINEALAVSIAGTSPPFYLTGSK